MIQAFLNDFKAFALKGNMLDLAVAVIVGGAFGKIVSSLVADVVMPVVGLLVGGVQFTSLKFVLKPETVDAAGKTVEAVTLNYGSFLQTGFDFLVIALAVFFMLKGILKLQSLNATPAEEAPAAPPAPSDEVLLLSEIRDLLKK